MHRAPCSYKTYLINSENACSGLISLVYIYLASPPSLPPSHPLSPPSLTYIQVLLPEGIAEIVKETVSAHHLQRHRNQPAIADLVRSSLLRDYHLTPVRAAWYREGDREAEQEDEASEQ